MNVKGTFYGCHNFELFKYICNKINNTNKNFILISSGSSAEKIYEVCSKIKELKIYYIYCLNKNKYIPLKDKYDKLKEVYNNFDNLKNKLFSLGNQKVEENIKSSNLIYFNDYNRIYIKLHYEIIRKYTLYKLLKSENYNESKFLELVKNKYSYYLDLAKQLLYHDDDDMIDFFKKNTDENEETLKKAFNGNHIIKNYIANYTIEGFYYRNLNKFLREGDFNSFRILSNHISKFIYHLFEYRKQNLQEYNNSKLYRIMTLSEEDFNIYTKSKGKIICYPSFTSTSLIENSFVPIFVEKNNYKYVKLIIEQNNSKSVISIRDIAEHKNENEYLFVPFSFFKILDAKKGLGTQENPHIIHLMALNSDKPIEEMILDFMQNETDNLDPEGLDMLMLTNNDKTIIINPNLFSK